MSRNKRKISPSNIYHIMLRGNDKKDIFLGENDKNRFIETVRVKKRENEFELYAFCLMDNHVHLLVNDVQGAISRTMKRICISYAMYFNNKYSHIGHFFQDRFRSEIVNDERYLLQIVRYIHNNPVKAGLVRFPGQFRWSSFCEYTSVHRLNNFTDTDFILDTFSADRRRAQLEFLKFSDLPDEECHFIDIEPEPIIPNIESAVLYINEFLLEKGIKYKDLMQQKGRSKDTIKHEIIKEINSKSNLSSREIAELLGVSKSSVNNLLRFGQKNRPPGQECNRGRGWTRRD